MKFLWILVILATKVFGQGIIDVRDYGVVGDGSTDDTTALNNAFTALPNFGTLLLPPPPNCKIKISSQITIANKFGIRVEQMGEADIGNTCGLLWFGPSGGTMIYIKEVHGSEWNHLTVRCSGAGTGFVSTAGCNTGILVDESVTPANITTNTGFHDLFVYNANPNPSFVGLDIGPNAPGNVENNYIYNAKVLCGGPATGDTDTGIRIGSAGTGSQPNNNKIIGGSGPTNCGRGFWLRGNTNVTDIGNIGPGENFNTLYVAGVNAVHYHDVEDQTSNTPIHIVQSGAALTIENYQTAGISGHEIQADTVASIYISVRNAQFSAPTTLSLAGSALQWSDGFVLGQDSTFCSTLQSQQSFKIASQTCQLFITNGPLNGQVTSALLVVSAMTSGEVAKLDPANAQFIIPTTTTDTGPGIPIGIVQNSVLGGQFGYVVTSGLISTPVLGTGTCAVGQFVIVDTTTNGRVKCTSTFTAGTVIGKAVTAQSTVGNTVNVLIQLQ